MVPIHGFGLQLQDAHEMGLRKIEWQEAVPPLGRMLAGTSVPLGPLCPGLQNARGQLPETPIHELP